MIVNQEVRCKKCSATIPEDERYCPQCGAPAQRSFLKWFLRAPQVSDAPVAHCPNCGALIKSKVKQCRTCGAALSGELVKDLPSAKDYLLAGLALVIIWGIVISLLFQVFSI